MSGHEWAPEPGELRGDDRPLSPAAGPDPGFARPDPVDEDGPGPDADDDGDAPEVRRRPGFRFRLPRFRARRDGDAVAEEGVVEVIAGPDAPDVDPDPGQGEEDDEAAAPRRGLPFRIALPRFRRPRVASDDDDDALPAVATAEGTVATVPDEEDEASPAARRFPAFGLSREARVGLAAALSFAILVAVWITNKGRALPPMKIPGGGDAKAPAQADPKEAPAVVASAENSGPAKPDAASPISAPAADAAAGGPAHEPDRAPVDNGSLARREAGDKPALPEAAPAPIDPVVPASPTEFPAAAPAALASATPPASPEPTLPEAPTPPGPGTPPPADAGGSVELPPSPSADPATPPMPAAAPGDVPQVATPTAPGSMPAPAGEPAGPATPASPPDLSAMPAPDAPAPDVAATPTPTPAATPTPAEPPPTSQPDPPAPASAGVPETGPAPTEPRPASLVPSNKVPPLDPVTPRSPGPGSDPSAMASPDAGDGWISIKGGGRRVVVSTPSSADGIGLAAASGALGGTVASIADRPAPRDDEAVLDQVEPKLHTVRSGENFWTISRLYYGTGRYYRALHAANAREVHEITDLWVGAVVRIPPPETLDRSLVEPPGRERVADKTAGASVSRTSNPGGTGGGADLSVPTRPAVRRRPEVEAPDEPPARPVYKVRGAHETLRGIARDTLDNPRRYREILNLNRSILDEDSVLKPGQAITLPADAVIGRRGR